MEKRSHARVEAQDRICITVLPKKFDNPASDTFYCRTDDLSESGVRFSGDANFEQGQILEMLVIRGGSYWGFDLKGRVVWVKKDPQGSSSSFGVELIETNEQTRLAWRGALARARGQNDA
jgi:hypothetical protein